jgi:hypothetical protein
MTKRRKNNKTSNSDKKISVRLQAWQRNLIDYCSENESLTITDIIKKSINSYFIQKDKPDQSLLKQMCKEKYYDLDLFSWSEKYTTKTSPTSSL